MSDVAALNNLVEKHNALKKEIGKIIVGHQVIFWVAKFWIKLGISNS